MSEFSLTDVHDENFEKVVLEQFAADIAALVADKASFVDTDCRACGSANRTHVLQHQGFDYQRCLDCGAHYIAPCPTEERIVKFLREGAYGKIWRDRMPARLVESRRAMYEERAAFTMAALQRFGPGVGPSGARVLEVGGGRGEMARALAALDGLDEMIVVEPQPLKINLPRVRVFEAPFGSMPQLEQKVDAVVAFEVIEHLVDPASFLRKAATCLVPGGLLVLSTPNIDGFQTQTLRQSTYTVGFDHVCLYNPRSIDVLLDRNGFQSLEISTPGRFDVDLVHREYVAGTLDTSANHALKFVMEDGYKYREEFQAFLQRERLSSSMRCIARHGSAAS